MWNLRSLLGRVRPVFNPLEKRLLQAVEARLSPSAAELFARQVAAVNLVQRHGGGREVCCYRMRGRRPYNDPALRFPDRSRERRLARGHFRVPGDAAARRAEFHLVDGFFFSIVFDAPTAGLGRGGVVEIDDLQIENDPMRPASPIATREMKEPWRFQGWLSRWAERHALKDVREPLSPADRKQRLAEIEAPLPRGYLDLAAQTDGFRIGDCRIFGLAESYEIRLDDGAYQVLAELDGRGILAVDAGSGFGQVFFLDYREDRPRREVRGFRAGVEAYLEGRLPEGAAA